MQGYGKAFRAGTLVFVGLVAGAAALSAQAPAADKKTPEKAARPAMAMHATDADGIKWGPAPPTLLPGASAAILAGDPSKAGELCILRIKAPNGYKVMPHTHPTDEHLTVIKGTLLFGMGEKWDDAAMKPLAAGGYKMTPKETAHFVQMKGETIVEVVGIGPLTMKYVNPDDDPSAKKTAPTGSK
jgi:quercetin dioxygenase-like cupin family protein